MLLLVPLSEQFRKAHPYRAGPQHSFGVYSVQSFLKVDPLKASATVKIPCIASLAPGIDRPAALLSFVQVGVPYTCSRDTNSVRIRAEASEAAKQMTQRER